MNAYTIIGIILVVTVLRILWVITKKKKRIFSSEQVQAAHKEIEERKFESDDITESSYVDSLHWTIEQEAKQAKEIEAPPNVMTLNKELQEVVSKILALPNDFDALRNKSQNQLVMESGYCEGHEQITERVIATMLALQPQRMEEWLHYSEDKRTSEGWFLRDEDSRFVVGTFTTKSGYKQALAEYPNLESACAAFIKREIEYSRKKIAANKKSE